MDLSSFKPQPRPHPPTYSKCNH